MGKKNTMRYCVRLHNNGELWFSDSNLGSRIAYSFQRLCGLMVIHST